MKHQTFLTWAIWAVAGIALISFTPERYRFILILTILLGGIVYLKKSGSLEELGAQLTGKVKDVAE